MLKDISILITAGATREPIDPVRYISNRSSGKMGFALAEAAYELGASVTVISGAHTAQLKYSNIALFEISTAQEMFDMVELNIKQNPPCIFIACAAVCDYRVKAVQDKKIKKHGNLTLELVENIDILKTFASKYPQMFTVGFAAETDNVIVNAQKKLVQKKLNMVIANDVSQINYGFDSDYNQVQIIMTDSIIELELKKKELIGREILQYIAKSFKGDK